ncbi:hypothetical protein [Tropicimonas sp. S265A]|uniref:hypothetical protein n=1 Tax=Tropicimonas sp. S265A TaxID=3415134 RepID=UPI003C7A5D5C
MRSPQSLIALEDLGRQRLSRYFAFRDFLHTEIGSLYQISNIPEDPALALASGRKLATELLDPLVETFGPVDIRSGYRSPSLNHFGATQVRPQKCAANEKNYAGHIWDRRDSEGRMGACVSVSIPWFAAQYAQGRDWRDLAWWLWDHLVFHEVYFFPKTAAFNLTWREQPEKRILSYIAPRGLLASASTSPPQGRSERYLDFPPFRAISYPWPDIPPV